MTANQRIEYIDETLREIERLSIVIAMQASNAREELIFFRQQIDRKEEKL